MGKTKAAVLPVSEAVKDLRKNIIRQVYFLFGEDSYSIDNLLSLLESKVQPFITTDFDREVIYSENKTAADIINSATAFPFGSDKKYVLVKDFEKIKDKKNLQNFLKSPPDFIVLVLLHNTPINSFDSEFYKLLISKGFIYEAKELKGKHLVNWLTDFVDSKGKILTEENAQLMVDISGENRSLLEMQLEKIITFLAEKREITYENIISQSAALKEHTIFELQNAIGKKDKAAATKIALNMLSKAVEPTFILYMLTKYFTGLARINELEQQNTNLYNAARIVGTHSFYYNDYRTARKNFSEIELINAAKALLEADEQIKTTSTDKSTVITLLINKILAPRHKDGQKKGH